MEKNHLNLSTLRLQLRKFTLTALITLSTLLAAQADSSLPASTRAGKIEVTAIGVSGGDMMFNIEFDNADEDKISIVLADEQGARLYREILNGKNIRKTFKTPVDIGTVVLIVTNMKTKTEKKFRIRTQQRLVEEVMVANVH